MNRETSETGVMMEKFFRRSAWVACAVILLAGMPSPFHLQAQEKPAAQGDVDIHKLLAKGINFDHVINWYQESSELVPALGEGQLAELEGKLKESDFQQVASLGFTHLRLNLGRAFIQQNQKPFGLRPEGLALLDKVVELALKNNLGIILDMHQVPAPNIFHDRESMDAFRSMWKGLAAHYAHQSPMIVFELLNEPAVDVLKDSSQAKEADLERWRGIVKNLVNTVHRKDPQRYVIVTGGGWGDIAGLLRMGNLHLPRVVYTFHYYNPMFFTHQGATWAGPTLQILHGIHYPIVPAEVKEWQDQAVEKNLNLWPFQQVAQGFNQDTMKADLQPVLDFAKKEGLVLYCGEFGVHKPFAPPKDRAHWIKDWVDLLNQNGVDWAMWAYHSGFDLVDEKGQPDPGVVKALGLGTPAK